MMPVKWEDSAINELASFWTTFDSQERGLVRAAIEQIDVILARDGDSAGESRENATIRVMLHSPVAIKFRVVFEDRQMMIKVIQFWPMYKRQR